MGSAASCSFLLPGCFIKAGRSDHLTSKDVNRAPFRTSTSQRRWANGSPAGSSFLLHAARIVLPLCVFRNMPARQTDGPESDTK